jgi:hypothetical protein
MRDHIIRYFPLAVSPRFMEFQLKEFLGQCVMQAELNAVCLVA